MAASVPRLLLLLYSLTPNEYQRPLGSRPRRTSLIGDISYNPCAETVDPMVGVIRSALAVLLTEGEHAAVEPKVSGHPATRLDRPASGGPSPIPSRKRSLDSCGCCCCCYENRRFPTWPPTKGCAAIGAAIP